MAVTSILVVRVIPLCVSGGHPAKHASHFAIFLRTDDEVPMVWHQCVRKQLHGVPLESFAQNPLKRSIIFLFVKDRGPQIGTIEGMVQPAGFVSAVPTRLVDEFDVRWAAAAVAAGLGFLWLGWIVFSAGLRRYTSGSVWTNG